MFMSRMSVKVVWCIDYPVLAAQVVLFILYFLKRNVTVPI